ncbi:hypothetical protein [Xanthomonas sp. LMG 12461]|uniref:hypothetical protein n=1 Tax=Xanthomonas sp. LMG 12461 TaxID=2014543 RepID=UPI00126410ED|nr:hypothetical protein [Xanthomonas sp. LMG 12461]
MSTIHKLSPVVPKPRLSDRNLARFVRMSASRQMRFLHDQKYPKGTPQVFMQPYYAKALAGIRDVMKRGFPGIIDARGKLQGIAQETRRNNSLRVLEAFIASPHAKRRLKIITGHRYQAYVRTLEVRFSPHVVAMDGNEVRYIYFHEKGVQCDSEEARLTLEFGYWVLTQNGIEAKPHQFELIDLFSGKYFQGQPMRPETLKMLDDMAQHIESQWTTIEP